MGSTISAILDVDTAVARDGLDALPGWFAGWERRLSRFQPDSELMRLNACAGQRRRVSSVLWHVLAASIAAARDTDGLVVPTVLGALIAVGYDRDFAAVVAGPTVRPAAQHSALHAWRAIQTFAADRSVYVPPGVQLDLGGVAKGWAAKTAAVRLSKFGPALVDAGGDLRVSGPRADGSSWPIGVADPRDPDRDLLVLALSDGGVATSGRDYRRWRHNGAWQHHVIDPRTGMPAITDVLTATVIGPDVLAAEIAAKVVLLLGCHSGLQWLDARPELAGVVVCDDSRIQYSHRLQHYLWET